MGKVFCFIKIFINILLYIFYGFISIIIGNFLYGAYLNLVLNVPVPPSHDIIHLKIAGFICLLILFITLIFRRVFYISIFKGKNKK